MCIAKYITNSSISMSLSYVCRFLVAVNVLFFYDFIFIRLSVLELKR